MDQFPFQSKKIVLAILLMAVAAGVYWYFSKPKLTIPEQAKNVIAKGVLASCDQFKGKIVNGNDYYVVCRNNIVWNAALANADASMCDQLDDVLMKRTDCRNIVLQKTAPPTADKKFIQMFLKNPTGIKCNDLPGFLVEDCLLYRTLGIRQDYDAGPISDNVCNQLMHPVLRNVCRTPMLLQTYISSEE